MAAPVTVVAILSLSLGIGANTAIFTLIDQILLRKLPVKNPDELVMLYQEGANNGSNGYELLKSDGTSAGTVLVKNINPTGSSLPKET